MKVFYECYRRLTKPAGLSGLSIACLLCLVAVLHASAQNWSPDILGGGYEARTIVMPQDYSGTPVCTVVRLKAEKPTDKAVLYIHGFNDYFFQREMGVEFVNHGYDFYAVDLRKYGRSLREGQVRGQLRSMDEYCQDIDSALSVIKATGVGEIILLGHSTGGLASAYYVATHHDNTIKGLILNSPFLDWNLGMEECFVGLVSAAASIVPSIEIETGGGNAYSHSLLKKYHGEWTFNTDWKNPSSTKVDLRWVRAIDNAQHELRRRIFSIRIPVLLLHSDKSIIVKDWTPAANSADVVLDVRDMESYGRLLGTDVTIVAVPDGLHDLSLSSPSVRSVYYHDIFSWLAEERL